MKTKEITHEIYDENGLVRVETITVQEEDYQELMEYREKQLLEIYEEIQFLKNKFQN